MVTPTFPLERRPLHLCLFPPPYYHFRLVCPAWGHLYRLMAQQVLVVAMVDLMSQDLEGVDHFLEGQGGVCSRVGWCGQSIRPHRCGAMYNKVGSTDRS